MSGEPVTLDRTTKYVTSVMELMREVGHATNAELLSMLRKKYPTLSATTIHRVTARLLDHGELQLGPSAHDGSMRYDVNTEPHDHFVCAQCGLVRDARLGAIVRPLIEAEVGGGCQISGSLTVSGLCKMCHKEDI